MNLSIGMGQQSVLVDACFQDLGGCIGNMSLSDAAACIQTIVIVIGFVMATFQFIRWRDAISYDKKLDLAVKINEATYRFQQEFTIARNPHIRYKKGFAEPQSNWGDTADAIFGSGGPTTEELEYDSKIRLEKIFTPLTEMSALRWQASLIFGPNLNPSLGEIFKEFERLYGDFAEAIYDRNTHMAFTSDPERARNIVGVPGAKDSEAFGCKIDETADKMLEALASQLSAPISRRLNKTKATAIQQLAKMKAAAWRGAP
jgi:hypothetical protein